MKKELTTPPDSIKVNDLIHFTLIIRDSSGIGVWNLVHDTYRCKHFMGSISPVMEKFINDAPELANIDITLELFNHKPVFTLKDPWDTLDVDIGDLEIHLNGISVGYISMEKCGGEILFPPVANAYTINDIGEMIINELKNRPMSDSNRKLYVQSIDCSVTEAFESLRSCERLSSMDIYK